MSERSQPSTGRVYKVNLSRPSGVSLRHALSEFEIGLLSDKSQQYLETLAFQLGTNDNLFENAAKEDLNSVYKLVDMLAEQKESVGLYPLIMRLISSGHGRSEDYLRCVRQQDLGFDYIKYDTIGILDLAVLQHPHASQLRLERARRFRQLGNISAAKAEALLAWNLGGSWTVDGFRELSEFFVAGDDITTDDINGAHVVLDHGLARFPNDAGLLSKKAALAIWGGKDHAAQYYLRRVISVAPDRLDSNLLLIRLLIKQRKFRDAEQLVKECLIRNDDPRLHAIYATLLVAAIAPTIPDYVDYRRLQALEAAIVAAGPALEPSVTWILLRLLRELGREEMARYVLPLAIAQLGEHDPLPDHIRDELRATISRGLFTVDAPSPDRRNLAGALVSNGLVSVATRQSLEALLSFSAASALVPSDNSARLNAAFVSMAYGSTTAVSEFLKPISRVYVDEMRRVAWPNSSGRAWPWLPFCLKHPFERQMDGVSKWPRITVITPSFNQGEYIEETILSVINQEYPNLQYIIVDGLSGDSTIQIIEKYRNSVDVVIVEPDNGQTDAINKGLRLADGELITWINSDDMLSPGALFALADVYLKKDADIIFGICLIHQDHSFVLANRPRVTQQTFTTTALCDIFGRWLKGEFFYQPEVIFTKRILTKVGGSLDAGLNFTMDYEFWLRCADAGAVVESVDWPIALFRQHPQQKTSNLADCVIEQAEVRGRFRNPRPSADRVEVIRLSLKYACDHKRPRVAIISSRKEKIFSEGAARDLKGALRKEAFVELVSSAAELTRAVHLVVKLVHLQNDLDDIALLRTKCAGVPIVGWFWDNHHHVVPNHEVAEALDVVVPGHGFASKYLLNDNAICGGCLPLCVTQWSASEAARFFHRMPAVERNGELYGGFVRYSFATKRNKLIEELIAAGESGVYFLDESEIDAYFKKDTELRFREWSQFKVSITIPLSGDLSQRLFDALITGQVPIVAADVHDLDYVISRRMQEELPVIRFDEYSVDSVRAAHKLALAAFDRGGTAGVQRRHGFALHNHTFDARVRSLISLVRELSVTAI